MIIQVIQLSRQTVTCCRFRKSGSSLTPVTGFRHTFENQEELKAHISESLQPLSEDTRTILALPAHLLTLRELQLPMQDRRKLRSILPFELASELVDTEQEIVCDALVLSDGTLLAGCCPVAEVRSYIHLLHECGVEPEVVTSAFLNWQHLPCPVEQSTPWALTDSEALMVCQDGHPLFVRALPENDNALTSTLTVLSLTKELEIANVFHLETVKVSSEIDTLLALPEVLTKANASGDLPATALTSPLAVALAYQNGEIFNLRNGALSWTHKRTHQFKQFRIPVILAAIVLALLFTESALRWYLLSRDIRSLNTSISKIYREVFPSRRKAVDEVAEIKAEIRRLRQGSSDNATLAFLKLLAESKPDQVTGLTEIELDGQRFKIKGEAKVNSAVTALQQKLVAAGWKTDQPEFTNRPDGSILFVLIGRQGSTQP